jgi:hypothetical protein
MRLTRNINVYGKYVLVITSAIKTLDGVGAQLRKTQEISKARDGEKSIMKKKHDATTFIEVAMAVK